MAGLWLPVPGPGELGREARGTRCSAIAVGLSLSFPSTKAPWGRMDPASAAAMGSSALLAPCTAPHRQLRGSPWESMGLPTASLSSWPWQMPSLCAGCMLGPALLAALPLSEFLCMPQVLCVQCLKRSEHPMAWRWGQAPALCLGMGSSEARVGQQFLGVTVGGDEDALWAHSHFPSQGGCFGQGVLALRQGRNGDACKLQRWAPLQHRAAGVSCQHSSPSYRVPPSLGQVTGVSPINPAPWWPLIGTPGFLPPPLTPSSCSTCFSPVHLLLNLCSRHPSCCWELVAVTRICPLNQGSGHPPGSAQCPEDVPAWSTASGCVVGGGLWAEHWAWGWARASVQKGWEAPGGFLGECLLGWLRMGDRWLLLFPPLPVAETTGLGTFNPPGAGPRDEPCTWMTRVGVWL